MIAKASKLHKSNRFMLNYSMRTNSKQGGTQNEKQKRAVRRVVYRRLRATHAVRSLGSTNHFSKNSPKIILICKYSTFTINLIPKL